MYSRESPAREVYLVRILLQINRPRRPLAQFTAPGRSPEALIGWTVSQAEVSSCAPEPVAATQIASTIWRLGPKTLSR